MYVFFKICANLCNSRVLKCFIKKYINLVKNKNINYKNYHENYYKFIKHVYFYIKFVILIIKTVV
jgi:hypothetical protein